MWHIVIRDKKYLVAAIEFIQTIPYNSEEVVSEDLLCFAITSIIRKFLTTYN